jgi:hypothetical protein
MGIFDITVYLRFQALREYMMCKNFGKKVSTTGNSLPGKCCTSKSYQLSVVNGLLLKGEKIVKPGTLRLYTLKSMDPCSRLSNKIL